MGYDHSEFASIMRICECDSCKNQDASHCLHHDSMWRWEPRGYSWISPAFAVYCNSCNTLLFTVLLDRLSSNKVIHKISVPNFHRIKWQEYILSIFRNRFPHDELVLTRRKRESKVGYA